MNVITFIAFVCISQLANSNADTSATVVGPEESQPVDETDKFRQDILMTLIRVTENLNSLIYNRENFIPSSREVISTFQNKSLTRVHDLVAQVLSQIKDSMTSGKHREEQLCYLNAEKSLLNGQVLTNGNLRVCLLRSHSITDKHVPIIDQAIVLVTYLANQLNKLLVSHKPAKNEENKTQVDACGADSLQQLKAVEVDLNKKVRQLMANGDTVVNRAEKYAEQCNNGVIAKITQRANIIQKTAIKCLGRH